MIKVSGMDSYGYSQLPSDSLFEEIDAKGVVLGVKEYARYEQKETQNRTEGYDHRLHRWCD